MINIDAILLDTLAVRVHDLLTDVAALGSRRHVLASASGVVATIIIGHIVIAACHILHLEIVHYRLLSIDLADEGLHALRKTLRDLR